MAIKSAEEGALRWSERWCRYRWLACRLDPYVVRVDMCHVCKRCWSRSELMERDKGSGSPVASLRVRDINGAGNHCAIHSEAGQSGQSIKFVLPVPALLVLKEQLVVVLRSILGNMESRRWCGLGVMGWVGHPMGPGTGVSTMAEVVH